MTTLTPAATRGTGRPAPAPSRIIPVLRLHLTNKWTSIGTPLLILAFIWAVSYVIWLLIWQGTAPDDRAKAMDGTQYAGAIFYIYVYMMVIAVQTVLRTFPFALGFSVTRRDFALGSGLFFVLLSAVFAVILTAASALETATNGWGVGGHMFSAVYFGDGPLGLKLLLSFSAFLFCFFLGAALSTVYLRWRSLGMTLFFGVLAVIGVGLAALATFTGSWGAVGAWFVAVGPTGVILWSLVPTALAAVLGFRILRRATPAG